jgi:hypothetical protein
MFRIILLAATLICLCTAARADAIDGTWCSDKGGHVAIVGPKITLSGKTTFTGQYARHVFIYTVPAGEEHPGDQIYMRLQGEEDMTSYTIKDDHAVDPVAWKRCVETS